MAEITPAGDMGWDPINVLIVTLQPGETENYR